MDIFVILSLIVFVGTLYAIVKIATDEKKVA